MIWIYGIPIIMILIYLIGKVGKFTIKVVLVVMCVGLVVWVAKSFISDILTPISNFTDLFDLPKS